MKKNKNKIIYLNEIKKRMQNILDTKYTEQKLYKTIHQMKKSWYIITLKKEIFYCKNPEQTLSEFELIDKFYRKFLQQHAKTYVWKERYIWWNKALSIHLWDFSVADEISVITPSKKSKETIIWDKKVIYKSFFKQNIALFPILKKYTIKQNIWPVRLHIANMPLALLETALEQDPLKNPMIFELIKKTCKKFWSLFTPLLQKQFEEIIKQWKRKTSLKRIHIISSTIHPKYDTFFWEIIKKHIR